MNLNELDKIERFYGNGLVFIANATKVKEFEHYNFDVVRIEGPQGPDQWILGEIIVALGSGISKKKAIKALRLVIQRMERGNVSEQASGFESATRPL